MLQFSDIAEGCGLEGLWHDFTMFNAMLNAHLTIVEYAVTVLGPDDITNGDI